MPKQHACERDSSVGIWRQGYNRLFARTWLSSTCMNALSCILFGLVCITNKTKSGRSSDCCFCYWLTIPKSFTEYFTFGARSSSLESWNQFHQFHSLKEEDYREVRFCVICSALSQIRNPPKTTFLRERERLRARFPCRLGCCNVVVDDVENRTLKLLANSQSTALDTDLPIKKNTPRPRQRHMPLLSTSGITQRPLGTP